MESYYLNELDLEMTGELNKSHTVVFFVNHRLPLEIESQNITSIES